MIPPHTLHNFSSMKLHLWERRRKFILALYIVIKGRFLFPVILSLERKLITMDMQFYLFSHLECEEPRYPACSLYLSFSSGGRLWVGMCWGEMLILKYFSMVCIQAAFWFRTDERTSLVSSLNDISMTYLQNETLKSNCEVCSQ